MGGLTRARIRLAERYGQPPLPGAVADYSAAEVMLVLAALRESEKTPKTKAARMALRAQPRIDHDRLLAIARQHDPDVKDGATDG